MKKLITFLFSIFSVFIFAQTNTFPSSGNVGIGTTTPSVPFQIGTTLNQGDQVFNFGNPQQYNQIIFKDRDFSNFRYGIQSGELKLGTSGNQHKLMSIQWNAHNIELWPTVAINSPSNILINAGQNVGIGKSNPAFKLDVNGTVNASQFLLNGNPLPTLSGSGNTFYLPATASLGIGTSNPQYPLDVNGDARISNNLYVGGGVVIADEVHAAHTVTAGTVSADTISTGVIVGGADVIGDITGSNKLTVGGNTELTGSLKVASLAGSGETPLFVDNNGNVFKQIPTPNWSCWPRIFNWNPGGNSFDALQNLFNPPPSDIGTCDNYDFILKANNVRRQWVKPDGSVTFGTNIGSNTGGPEYRFKMGVIRLKNTNTYGGPQIIFDLDDNSSTFGDWGIEYTKSLPGKDGLNFWKPYGSTNSDNAFMLIADDGMIGIGTDNPSTKLTIDAWSNDGLKILTDPNKLVINVFNKSTNKSEFLVKSNGFVYAREINVLPNNLTFPDYVFEKNYKRLLISELDAFIKKNKHLPNIPTAKEVEKNGINLAEMQILQMEKLEEAFLYIIDLKKENDELRKRISRLEKKNKKE